MFYTLLGLPMLKLLLSCSGVEVQQAPDAERAFILDCQNTTDAPCRAIVASHQGNPVQLELSGVVWSEHFKKAFIVSDNFNDLSTQGTGHFVISYFSYAEEERELTALPLLSKKQAEDFKLYDLEGIGLQATRLYAIGSLGLHGKNPDRDRRERYQFVQMDLKEHRGRIIAENLKHVSARWPNFRDWVLTRSGHQWSSKELLGRAEGEGINVEALTATSKGTLIIGFRGPAHTLRGMAEMPGNPRYYYLILGPKGYEKESLFLVVWDTEDNHLEKVVELPKGFVAEGVTSIAPGIVLVVDDLSGMVLMATETTPKP